MAQFPLIRQNQAGNAHIDGATPSYLPTSINQPNQNMPHRSLSQDRRQLRHLCPKKDNPDVFPGGFASCLGKTLMSFLVVLPPVLGQLWCLSWWFCRLSWDTSDRCGICWLGWLMDVGRYDGVAPSMWAFAAWFWQMSGSCAIYVPKNDLFFAIFYALAICHFAWPRKMGPTKSPEKEFFPEFPKGNLTLGGVRFPGANPSGKLALRWFPPIFFLNIKLPFWDIDGATPRELRHLCPKKAAWCW